jgi:hypothetical protein
MWRRGSSNFWQLSDPIWQQEPFDERTPLDELIARIDPRHRVARRA